MDRRVSRWVLLVSLTASGSAFAAAGCSDEESGKPVGTTAGSSVSSSTSTSVGSSSSSGAGGAGGHGAGGAGGAAPVSVVIQFEGRVGAAVFDCTKTYAGLGLAATDMKISDYRLYVHDLRLHRKGGADTAVDLDQDGLWQTQDLALLDFEDKSGSCANGTVETNAKIHGKVPAGDYDGLSFRLGVPFALNHADVSIAPSPLNLSGLFWDWNYGYKFLRIDSAPAAGGAPFLLHLGSTDCMGDFADGGVKSCARPNVADVILTGFDAKKNKVVVDYAAVLAGSDLSKNLGGPPGCMSGPMDPECGPVFQRLGIDIKDGSNHPDLQKLFHVE